MSEFRVPVVRIRTITKHPNADTLSITQVDGENVIIKTGDYTEGDLAVYIPVDGVVPSSVPGTEFLGDHRRIKAKRLRGVYSEGLLLPLQRTIASLGASVVVEGDDLAAHLGITKHQDKVPDTWGTSVSGASVPSKRGLLGRFFHWCFRDQLRTHERDPGCLPVYDIEPYGRYKHLLRPGERVIITEKIHGTNARYCHLEDPNKFYAGSRNNFWRDLINREIPRRERFGDFVRKYILRRPARGSLKPNLYCAIAHQYDLPTKLKGYSSLGFYGEIYGQVQDLRYDAEPGQIWFRVFDIYDTQLGEWLDWDSVRAICEDLGIDTVPVLYDGPFDEAKLASLVEGQSVLAKNIREGIVVKPADTRVEEHFGRLILKQVSQAYKLRKGGTELQ